MDLHSIPIIFTKYLPVTVYFERRWITTFNPLAGGYLVADSLLSIAKNNIYFIRALPPLQVLAPILEGRPAMCSVEQGSRTAI